MDSLSTSPAELRVRAPQADADLVARAARGDAAAFEAIMRRHNRLLFRSARGIVGDDAEAQDVVQETWLKAFGSLDGFRGDSALGTWLARIAIRVAIDTLRRRGRIVSLDETGEPAAETAPEHVMSTAARAEESPDRHAERSQLRAILQQAIDGLPPIYRSVFILRAVEEMSVEQAADCLQVSDAVVKTRYLRAREKLRDALAARLEADTQDTYAFAGARCDAVVAHVMEALRRDGRTRADGSA